MRALPQRCCLWPIVAIDQPIGKAKEKPKEKIRSTVFFWFVAYNIVIEDETATGGVTPANMGGDL
ncbi:MAG: hypothetical protein EA342_01890 [Leptolyngbya sp. LCM1.Bin17]|nr:MAG: hypothetical protein EA342_01890 [Leptolyngbya sp. LCM1.Bin17]